MKVCHERSPCYSRQRTRCVTGTKLLTGTGTAAVVCELVCVLPSVLCIIHSVLCCMVSYKGPHINVHTSKDSSWIMIRTETEIYAQPEECPDKTVCSCLQWVCVKIDLLLPLFSSYPRCTPSGLIMMYDRSMPIVGRLVLASGTTAET